MNAGGPSKLAVVKLVKELTGKGLKESKDLVDNAPTTSVSYTHLTLPTKA